MRNLFLGLILANLLLLAWHAWIDPPRPGGEGVGRNDLALFGGDQTDARNSASAPEVAGECMRIGPLGTDAAAQQAGVRLVARSIDATPVAVETQEWLGHWVQIDGFASVADGEAARQRLADGGLPDAYLMQDGPEPVISLGVFSQRARAERVGSAARALGFEVKLRDRVRPAVEHWLLIRPRAGQKLGSAELGLAGDRIMRLESTPCSPATSAQDG